MQNPASMLESYRQHSHRLLAQVEQLEQVEKNRPHVEDLTARATRELFGTTWKTARGVSKLLLNTPESRQQAQGIAADFEAWHSHVLSLVRTVSVKRIGLTRNGNSGQLAQRFLRAKEGQRLKSRIMKCAAFMDQLCAMDLVFNADIPAYLDEQARGRALERRRQRERRLFADTKGFVELGGRAPVHRGEVERALIGHPEVARILLGALDALAGDSADGPRQACSSARTALEALVKELAGEKHWRMGLSKLVTGSRREMIGGVYDFLSARVHGPAPTRSEASYQVKLAVASCLFLVTELTYSRDRPPN